MRVDVVSHAPDYAPVQHTDPRCTRLVCLCGAHVRAERGLLFVFGVRLTHADIGAALRSYQLTGDNTLADTLRVLIEATLIGMLHRGTVGLRADALTASGDIEIGRAHTD